MGRRGTGQVFGLEGRGGSGKGNEGPSRCGYGLGSVHGVPWRTTTMYKRSSPRLASPRPVYPPLHPAAHLWPRCAVQSRVDALEPRPPRPRPRTRRGIATSSIRTRTPAAAGGGGGTAAGAAAVRAVKVQPAAVRQAVRIRQRGARVPGGRHVPGGAGGNGRVGRNLHARRQLVVVGWSHELWSAGSEGRPGRKGWAAGMG